LLLTVSELGLEVRYVPAVHYVTISLPAHRCANKTEGMCGDCNGVSSNDMVMRNHILTEDATEFAYSWNFPKNEEEICVKPEPISQHCTRDPDPLCLKISEGEEFAQCRSLVDFSKLLKNETCSKNYPACDWLAAFAEVCRHAGACVDWRTDTACSMRCPAGRVYDACRDSPYEKSCTQPSKKVNEPIEGCFLQCADDEVVVDGVCRSNKLCSKCFDNDAAVYREAGEKWTPETNRCRECECDAETLKVKCGDRVCKKKVPLPVCGDCEIPRVSGADPCCPTNQHCDCDSSCNALKPRCQHGEQEQRMTDEPGCRPVYRCKCDQDLCTERRITCDSPKVLVEVPTSCCPVIKCVCPKCSNQMLPCFAEDTFLIYSLKKYHFCQNKLFKIVQCEEPEPSDCSLGYKTVCEKISCCVECRCIPDAVCLVNETMLQKPGDSFDIDACTSCNCTETIGTDGFHVSDCSVTICDDCAEVIQGFKVTEVRGSCCGLCKPERCTLTLPYHGENKTQILEVNEIYRHRCSQYKCISDSSGYAVIVATEVFCPLVNVTRCIDNGGVVVYDDDGCCAECYQSQRTCHATKSQPKSLSIGGCETDRPVELAYCQGECASGSHYHEITGSFIRHCTCCSATEYYNMSIPATCDNGTQTQLNFKMITSCTCHEN
uniref:CTCK domain-containing protein n=1 Tax=Ciona intestinalis TaxID=7719 RepID=F6RAC0_CIOIN